MTVAAPISTLAKLQYPLDVPRSVPGVKTWSREQFQALGDFGCFEGRRASLIDGIIWEEGPMDPPHALGVQLLQAELSRIFGAGYGVRVQLPFNVGEASDPLPDLAVVKGSPRDFATSHPTEAILVAEISDSSLQTDLTVKAEKYAEAAVPEYWAVDLNGKQLHVLRNPGSLSPGGFAFADQRIFVPGDSISPLAAPAATVNVADLF